MKVSGSVIVSWDFSEGKDVGVLIVGEQKNGRVQIINAYSGQEAEDYSYLNYNAPVDAPQNLFGE